VRSRTTIRNATAGRAAIASTKTTMMATTTITAGRRRHWQHTDGGPADEDGDRDDAAAGRDADGATAAADRHEHAGVDTNTDEDVRHHTGAVHADGDGHAVAATTWTRREAPRMMRGASSCAAREGDGTTAFLSAVHAVPSPPPAPPRCHSRPGATLQRLNRPVYGMYPFER
jgi:hypothetical protein